MRRTLAAAAAALTFLVLAPCAYAAKGFSYGVTAGDVTANSAILWAKANKSGRYVLELDRRRSFRSPHRRAFAVRARARDDNTVQRKVKGLVPGARYLFRFVGRRGRRSDTGTFLTAPPPRRAATIEFAWTGDTDFLPGPGETRPYWNSGRVFSSMRAERNDFNIHLGDTIYSDTEVPEREGAIPRIPAVPPALTVEEKWAKYRLNLGNRHLRGLRSAAGFYSHWDDHEFINDFSRQEDTFPNVLSKITATVSGEKLYRRGVRAFVDYSPVTYSSRDGIYRSVRWGRNLELFFLDERSFRDAKASADGVCNNPATGAPDVAPTGPQAVRSAFAAVYAPLNQPVSPQCLAALRDPERDFLGDRQFSRFTRAIKRSRARFKVIMNEMPIQQYYVLPYDRWEGYAAERERLLRFLEKNVKNVIFLTTDVHATLVGDARFQTLEPGGARNSGIFDFTVGSAATFNFDGEIDTAVGREGVGQLVRSAFLVPDPPAGIGMRCVVIDQFTYGQVKVTRKALRVTAKDINGRPLRGCKPLVIRHRR
jgi:alkaline phosphatase D